MFLSLSVSKCVNVSFHITSLDGVWIHMVFKKKKIAEGSRAAVSTYKVKYIKIQPNNRPQNNALGNKCRVCGVYSPEPRADVYCFSLNLCLSKLVYLHLIVAMHADSSEPSFLIKITMSSIAISLKSSIFD